MGLHCAHMQAGQLRLCAVPRPMRLWANAVPAPTPRCSKNGTKLKVAHKPVRAGLYPTIGLHRWAGKLSDHSCS